MVPSPSAPAAEYRRTPAPVWFPPAATALAALAPRGCRWPLGEPRSQGFAFCAAPRLPGGSYCALHQRRSRGGAVAPGGRA